MVNTIFFKKYMPQESYTVIFGQFFLVLCSFLGYFSSQLPKAKLCNEPQYVYSGVRQKIRNPLPEYFRVDSCKNCVISFYEQSWHIEPSDPGESILYYSEPQNKEQMEMHFKVLQFSDLVVGFLPSYGHKAIGDGGIHLRCYHDPDTDIEKEIAQGISPSLKVFLFGINIYNEKNELIFEGVNRGPTFSCSNRDSVIMHYQKKHVIKIVDVEILLPDGSLESYKDTVVLNRRVW